MPLTIPDDWLGRAEIAGRLYHAEKLDLPTGARWARLSRTEFESELMGRGLPLSRLTEQDLTDDLSALDKLGV